MKYKIVKDIYLSGKKCSIYSVFVEEYNTTLFERFVKEGLSEHKADILNILDRIQVIAHETGARPTYFKEHEGKPGDLVSALFDTPDKNLRLYCIRYGTMLILLGGGGPKPESIKSWQQDEKLKEEAEWMIKVSQGLYLRQREKEIWFINNDMDFKGDLQFGYDEEDQ